MYWLMTSLFLAAEPKKVEKIYVAPPTIHDPILSTYQPYINSLLVSTANTNTHWVARSNRAESAIIMDKHTVEAMLDTTCNYNRPLVCGSENYHWVMITDMFTTEHFATIVIKLYDENTNLIASNSRTSYSFQGGLPLPSRHLSRRPALEVSCGPLPTGLKSGRPSNLVAAGPTVPRASRAAAPRQRQTAALVQLVAMLVPLAGAAIKRQRHDGE